MIILYIFESVTYYIYEWGILLLEKNVYIVMFTTATMLKIIEY